jgi:serine/threonine-protein kinase
VLDFGLARFAQEGEADAGSVTDPSLVLGTPDYLAPEQARNSSDVDGRTDLYSLGCTFYFLLTGRVPFPGRTPFEKLIAHSEAEPAPLDRERPGLPREVESIVRKLMAKRREDRYQTPAELATLLAPFARQATTAGDLIPEAIPVADKVPLAETVAMPAQAEATETPLGSELQFAGDTEPQSPRRAAQRPRRHHQKANNHRKLIVAGLIGGGLLVAAILVGMALRGDRSAGSTPDDGKGLVADKQRPDGVTRPRPDTIPKKNPIAKEGDRERTVLFVLPERYWHNDLAPARAVLIEAGHRVVLSSTANRVYPSQGSGRDPSEGLDVERRLGSSIRGGDFDAIVFVGGDMANLRGNRDAWRVVEEARSSKKIVAAICAGQQVLIDAGVLAGKTAAHSPDRLRFYGEADGINWDYQRRVVTALRTDMNGVPLESPIITAAGPTDSREFGDKLVFALARMP